MHRHTTARPFRAPAPRSTTPSPALRVAALGGAPRPALASGAMKVTLPDGRSLELPDGATGADLARAIGPGLAKAALAVKVDGRGRRPRPRRCRTASAVEIVTDRSPEALDLIRHDAAHVMATAVMELYPGTKISIGPPIENGFYYDFEFPEGVKVSDEDLARIEERMREHIAADEPFERTDVDPVRGRAALRRRGAGLQGRADPRPRRRRGGEDRLAVPERPVHGPVPGPARARPPGGSRRSSCCRWRARTGAATSATRC